MKKFQLYYVAYQEHFIENDLYVEARAWKKI